MKRIEGLIKGLQLFSNRGTNDVDANHDIILAGFDPNNMTDEECSDLKEWGWHKEIEYDCWAFFT